MGSVICDFIQQHSDNWRELMAEKHITVSEQDNLALFKYKIDADFFDPVVKEARGIIIDLEELIPVCRPFDKFGNYGEPYADKIDWSTAKVQEKVDGSIMKLWYYGGKWNISTNGVIDAFTAENSEGHNFGGMFVDAMLEQNKMIFQLDSPLDKDYTYIFELVSPDNQIVVQYDKTEVYHLGTRRNFDGEEIEVNIGIQKPKEYALSSLEECIEFANTFDGREHEGFVVRDAAYRRIKVKSEDYLRLHYMAGNGMLSLSSAIDIVLNNEIDEYCTYFPHKRDRLEDILNRITDEIFDIYDELEEFRKAGLPDRKDFAIANHHLPHFKFYMDVLYGGKPLKIDKKYWLNFFN